MSDLFQEKSETCDTNERIKKRSTAIGECILKNVALNKQMHILDFGAGTGLISTQIAPYVRQITAVDISESMLQKLISKPELKGVVKVLCHDLTTTPTGEKYDLIISAMSLHHIEDTNNLIKQFSAHLKEGGKIALSDLDTEPGTFHTPGSEGIFHFGFDRHELSQILMMNSFENIQFFTAYNEIKEDFLYPIFLVVATK